MSELDMCCTYTIAVQDNPIFTGKCLHCDSCGQGLRYTGTDWKYEPFEGLCNSAKCETGHARDEPPAPRATERQRSHWEYQELNGKHGVFEGNLLIAVVGECFARPAEAAVVARQIVVDNNQHDTLIEQRDRLVKALRDLLECSRCQNGCAPDDMSCATSQADSVLATIEQEGEA